MVPTKDIPNMPTDKMNPVYNKFGLWGLKKAVPKNKADANKLAPRKLLLILCPSWLVILVSR